jgi:hypothetical protein
VGTMEKKIIEVDVSEVELNLSKYISLALSGMIVRIQNGKKSSEIVDLIVSKPKERNISFGAFSSKDFKGNGEKVFENDFDIETMFEENEQQIL